MVHGAPLIQILREFEDRVQARPCSRRDLDALEREFEAVLRTAREPGGDLFAANGLPAETKVLLAAADTVRLTLRKSVIAHDRARSEILRIQGMIARGHVRAAVIESVKARKLVDEFSDLKLDFVTEAEARLESQQRILLAAGVLLSVAILVAATLFQIFRRSIPH